MGAKRVQWVATGDGAGAHARCNVSRRRAQRRCRSRRMQPRRHAAPRALRQLRRSALRSGAPAARSIPCDRPRRGARPRGRRVDAEFIVALDVVAAAREGVSEAEFRPPAKSPWLDTADTNRRRASIRSSKRPRSRRAGQRYDAITLSETPVRADPVETAGLLAEPGSTAARCRHTQVLRRLEFAVSRSTPETPVRRPRRPGASPIDLEACFPFAIKRALSDCAPASIVRRGRSTTLDYGEDGSVSASVKLRLFGLAQSPDGGTANAGDATCAPTGRRCKPRKTFQFWSALS